MKHASIDMTHGRLLGKILLFSLPLMASNVAQLLFNAADVIVVGRYAGYASLAAVGSTVSVIYLFVNLLMGISVGVNVVIARYLGMGDYGEEISRALHTAVLVAAAGGVIFACTGIFASGWMLDRISVPDDVRPLALLYIRIYFMGTPFLMLYNYGAAALRAAGDTQRPLVFMLVSGTVNLALNLLFVICLHMDVAGVALATVLSQGLSAALVLRSLSMGGMRFRWRKLCLDRRAFVDMARIGIPAGVQSCLFSLSNVVIQGAVNSYGRVVMAGCGAGESIENFLYVAMNSFHQASQTFISQNMGAGKEERVGQILRICLLCTLTLGIAQSAAVAALANPLIAIYNQDPAVIAAGAQRLYTVASLYVIFGLADVMIGALRGYGYPIVPVFINLLGTCAFRLVWVGLLDTGTQGVEWVYFSYPISWALVLTAVSVFWFILRRKRKMEVIDS